MKAGGLDRSPDAVTATGLLLPARKWIALASRRLERAAPGHPGMGRRVLCVGCSPRNCAFRNCRPPNRGRVGDVRSTEPACEIDSWGVGLFRPVSHRRRTAKAIEDRSDADQYRPAIAQLLSPKVQVIEVSDRANRSRPAFVGHAGASFLPELPASVTRELMRRPFRDALKPSGLADPMARFATPRQRRLRSRLCRGITWRRSWVPTRTSCQQCHRTVAQHARTFDRHRGWYGHVRGDDDVFTFHPGGTETFPTTARRLPARLRKSFVESGVVEWYDDPKKHPPMLSPDQLAGPEK